MKQEPQSLFEPAKSPRNAQEVTYMLHAAILRKYAAAEWMVLSEFRFSTGFSNYAERTMDALVINAYPSKSHARIVFEIKATVADFRRELAEPLKRKPALYISNQYYFLTPPGLIAAQIIPPEAGLIEADEKDWRVIVPAPMRDSYPPPWGMVASLARRVIEEQVRRAQAEAQLKNLKAGKAPA